MRQAFAGTGRLFRLALRRDRIKLPIWIACIGLFFFASISSVAQIYNDQTELLTYATTAISNMALFFNGPFAGPTIESIAVTETMTFSAIFVALMPTLLVVRHTRQNEELGMAELIGAGVVGRFAQIVAALGLAVAANIVLTVGIAMAYAAQGFSLEGSVLAGASLGGVGIVFAAIAALTAQIAPTTRMANGLAAGSIGLFFLLRGVGDMLGTIDLKALSAEPHWLSWLSPIGIARASQPYTDNHWWALGLLALITLGIAAVTMIVASKRDFGAGLLATGKGRPVANKILLSTVGLAIRMQKGLFIGWLSGLAVLALTLGAVVEEVKKFTDASGDIAQVITALGGSQNLVNAYLGFAIMLFGVTVSAYAIQAALRVRSEEAQGRLELQLATKIGRTKWLASNIVVVAVAATLMLAACGVLTGLAYSLTSGVDFWQTVTQLKIAAVVYLPVALLFAGLATLAFGIIPGWSIAAAWVVFAISYIILQFATLLNLPNWAVNLSPFSHTPLMPAEDFAFVPLASLLAIAVGLFAAGLLGFNKRDLSTT